VPLIQRRSVTRARFVLESSLVVVKVDSPYRTLRDFIEAAKTELGKLKQSGGLVARMRDMPKDAGLRVYR